VPKFGWGKARLRLNMSKNEVLAEIARSGLPDFNGRFGISSPPRSLVDKPVWVLSYGTSSGAAPGGGSLRLTFKGDKLTKVEVYSGPQPA